MAKLNRQREEASVLDDIIEFEDSLVKEPLKALGYNLKPLTNDVKWHWHELIPYLPSGTARELPFYGGDVKLRPMSYHEAKYLANLDEEMSWSDREAINDNILAQCSNIENLDLIPEIDRTWLLLRLRSKNHPDASFDLSYSCDCGKDFDFKLPVESILVRPYTPAESEYVAVGGLKFFLRPPNHGQAKTFAIALDELDDQSRDDVIEQLSLVIWRITDGTTEFAEPDNVFSAYNAIGGLPKAIVDELVGKYNDSAFSDCGISVEPFTKTCPHCQEQKEVSIEMMDLFHLA